MNLCSHTGWLGKLPTPGTVYRTRSNYSNILIPRTTSFSILFPSEFIEHAESRIFRTVLINLKATRYVACVNQTWQKLERTTQSSALLQRSEATMFIEESAATSRTASKSRKGTWKRWRSFHNRCL